MGEFRAWHVSYVSIKLLAEKEKQTLERCHHPEHTEIIQLSQACLGTCAVATDNMVNV